MKKTSLILLLFLLSALLCGAQGRKVILSGYVRDAASGEPLAQAVVYTPDKKYGVATDGNGFYSLSLPAGTQTILCTYYGYKTANVALSLKDAHKSLDFNLEENQDELEAAKIFSSSKSAEIKLPQMGLQRVDGAMIRQLPAMMGEVDIIRVIQMMPGVQAPSEGSTGFSVRGGGLDQNLILLDGAPIYNCGHFLGFLSMFNGDAIRGADLYKGDFPSLYGGRISSVLDISTKDGNNQSFSGNASVGLISSKLLIEGPIVPGKLSFLLAGRRTYLELFKPLLKKRIPENTRIYFYDVNAKLSWTADEKNRFYLSAFSGKDVNALGLEELQLDEALFAFANHTQSLRWNHVWSPKLTSDVIVYNSLYKNDLGIDKEDSSFDIHQSIRETGFKAGWTWFLGEHNTLKGGFQAAWLKLEPGHTIPRDENSLIQEVEMAGNTAFQPSFYLQNEQKLGRLSLRYGLRYSLFTSMGPTEQQYFDPETHELTETRSFKKGERIKTYWGLEPRVSVSFPFTDDFSVKAAYARTFQYLQQTRTSITGSPVDAWFTASPNVKPQRCDMYSLGFHWLLARQALDLSLEGFWKDCRNTLDFRDNAGIVLLNPEREGLLRTGTSSSFGTELMLKYDFDRWNGWLAYTWSRTRYKIPEINDGVAYPSPLNHEHSVNFVLACDITRQLSASTEWVYYSGAPTTYPVGRFEYMGRWMRLYSTRNADRMPDYHRLDLSLSWRTARRLEGKRWGAEWTLSLYNAYARHNAWAVSFHYNRDNDTPEAQMTWLFTIIPSLSCNVKF